MWRDSRKYGIWLHLITQSPSLIPPGIPPTGKAVYLPDKTGQIPDRLGLLACILLFRWTTVNHPRS